MNVMFTRLSTTELASFANQVISTSKNGNYKSAEENVLLEKLEQEYQKYSQVYTKLSYSGKGKDVQKVDSERSKSFNSLRNLVRAYKDVPSMPNVAVARELYSVFQTHSPKITGLGYSEKSALLKKLVEELDTEANKAKMTTLGVIAAFNHLKETNTTFSSLYIEQAEANAGLRLQTSASDGRKDLEIAFRNYLTYLSVMKSTSSEWGSLYADVNELVKYYSANIKSQMTRRKKKTDKKKEGSAPANNKVQPPKEDTNKDKGNTRPTNSVELPIHDVTVEGEEISADMAE